MTQIIIGSTSKIVPALNRIVKMKRYAEELLLLNSVEAKVIPPEENPLNFPFTWDEASTIL